MKIIDLLNKMAHGEEVPEKIKVDNIIYIYENLEHFYYTDNEAREDLLIRGKDYSTNDFLNWNVELIEEDTIDIDSIKEAEDLFEKHNADIDDKLCIQQNRRLINKLIRCVKQHDKEIKELKEK